MPTIAMKTFRPSVFISTRAGVGMRPKVGRMARRYPSTRPARSTPPDVDRPIGIPPQFTLSAPDQAAEKNAARDGHQVGGLERPIGDAERFDGRVHVADAPRDGQDVAAEHLRLGQDRDLDHVPGDLPEVDAACERLIGELAQASCR